LRTLSCALVPAAMALACLPAGSVHAQIYTRVNPRGVIEATNVPESSAYRLTYPGKGTLIHSRGFRVASYHGQFDRDIHAAAATFDVTADLIKAVIQVESEFDPQAVSSKGAQGLMQLMPFTARRFGVADAFEPRQNIFGGVQYLRFLLDLFRGDVDLALAAYNAGENAVLRHGGVPPYKETRGYVRKVHDLIGQISFVSPPPSQAVGYAPSGIFSRPVSSGRIKPARPCIYYKFVDARGTLRVSQSPPSEGISYTLLRALD
jgi:soluble lytic murein transglycosylase-like protein